jgi:diguanylate cyclase (GGDEF)-like protein/PAS domain S-box-containing protein
VKPGEVPPMPTEEDRLRARVRKLAEEKSYLQLIIRLIEQINPLPGIEDMLTGLFHSIVDTIGGTNIKLYYWIDNDLHYADFAGQRRILAAIDDAAAAASAERRELVEEAKDSADGLMRGDVSPGTWTWAFPLLVGEELFGVIKLENLHFPAGSLRDYLPIFFSHTALILSNEIRNLTRRRNEESLRLAASVFDTIREGIVITDAENNIVDVNPGFTRITGYSAAEALGRNPRMLASGRHERAFYTEMWDALTTRKSWRGEIWNRRKSGEIYPELVSIVAVENDSGALLRYVGVFSDISQIKAHEAELDHIAHYDTLTGVPNRRLLADRMNQAIARVRRERKPFAVCYLDLDGFKPINDRYGHEAGDRLLVALTRSLQDVLRAGDTIARLGGDEFVLLLNDVGTGADCNAMLERILGATSRPIDIDNVQLALSASIGVTIYPNDNSDADTLLRHADQAMYWAKEGGRNRYHLFDIDHDRAVKARVESRKRIAEALSRREFVMYYQPQVDLVARRVVAVEALIRWQHPQRGLLLPGAFLGGIDDVGLEVAMGEYVLEAVLGQAAAWKKAGLELRASINIGANHLQQPGFVERLQQLLRRHPALRPGDLELEILESAAIEDLTSAVRNLSQGAAQGLRFALDDFGTGYSSLGYLGQLPVDTLKIDRGFVRGMLADSVNLGIVESIVHLARAFNMTVVAEGVETRQQADKLIELGCTLVQGFGVARPMPAEQLPGWIDSWQGNADWCEAVPAPAATMAGHAS